MRKLNSKNPAIRRDALLSLSPVKDFKLIKNFLVNDSSCVIRHEAAFLLAESKLKKAIKPLVVAILNDKSFLVKHEAIEALGDLGYKERNVMRLLKKYSKNKNEILKESAEIALTRLQNK